MLYYVNMNIKKWIVENTFDLSNKTIAITGSTGKLANHVVRVLAALNANFIFLNRNKEKTEKQINELSTLFPNIEIEFIECDLSNFKSVQSAVNLLKQKRVDILYLAAGAYNIPRYKTDLEFDNVFQINFISQYYIAKELLNQIKTANGKVVMVGSIAHNYSKIDEKDIDFSTRKKHSKVYGNAKRFLSFSLMRLCKNMNVNFSLVHPGVTLTEMTNHYLKTINWLIKIFIGLFCPNTVKACLSLIKGVFENTSPQHWLGPGVLNVWGKPKEKKLKCSKDECDKIFKIAENIYENLKK